MRPFVLAFVAAMPVLALAGCDRSDLPSVTRPPTDAGGQDVAVHDAAGSDASPVDAGDDATVDVDVPDAPQVPVRVGVSPTARVVDDAGAAPIDEAQSVLDVIALGSRSVTIVRRWDQLFNAALQPDAGEWSRLSSTAALLAQSKRKLVLAIAIVDRTQDARPAGLGAWDSAATLSASDLLVDKVFATFGDELEYLAVGSEVDRWMTLASPTDESGFVKLATHIVDYARSQPARPAQTQVGVSATLAGIVSGAPDVVKLEHSGDVAMASYFPHDADFNARAPSVAPADLDALVSALTTDGGAPPQVALVQVGYPSATEAAGSEAKQKAFFDSLFSALLTRRAEFPLIVVKELDDPPDATCQHDALALGAAGNAAAVAFSCSLGLRRADGAPKSAFASIVDGLATFASP